MDVGAEPDLVLALRAVLDAGAEVARVFGTGPAVRHKGPGQPVTEADLEADRMLRRILTGARPADGWLSEETRDRPDRLSRSRVWIVDPLDGTRSFLEDTPEFALSVGLAQDGAVRVGVIHNPVRGETYWAVRGEGAYMATRWAGEEPRNARRLTVMPPAGPPRVLASRHEMADGEFDAFPDDWTLVPTGSTAYKLARLAAGDGDAFVSRGPKSEWDVCAGVVLVEEAGGAVTDLDGRSVTFNRADPGVRGVVAGAPSAHATVLELVRRLPPTARMAGGGARNGRTP